MFRNLSTVLFVGVLLFPGFASLAKADSAMVLPKGRSSIVVTGKFYFPIDEKYNENGDAEPLGDNFNTSLDSSVFPALASFESPPFGLPVASIGDSEVTFEWHIDKIETLIGYGASDKLTIGFKIPYYLTSENEVTANLNTENATVGKNPLHGQANDPFGGQAPLVPLAAGGVPLTTDDVQSMLGKGLDVNGDGSIDIPGYGFDRVATWSDRGIGDMEIGAKYQYFKNEKFRLAFTGALRLPTGNVANPDSLSDKGMGNGVTALLFYFYNDYTGIKNLLLNATLKYEAFLEDDLLLRIPEDQDQPITTNKEVVSIDYGDILEVELQGYYKFTKTFGAFLGYRYGYSFENNVSGSKDFPYESLEAETESYQHVYKIGLTYTTMPLFQEKKFPIPLSAAIYFRDRFAGKNIWKSQYIGVNLTAYF